MKAMSLLKPLAAAALLAAAGVSQAALTPYTSASAWLANVGANGTDTFAGFNIVGTTPSPINRNAGSFTYTASATQGFFGGGTTLDPFLSTNDNADTITFNTFGAGVVAIAGEFFGSNVNGGFEATGMTITVTDSLGATASITLNPTSLTAGSFAGWVSNGLITSVTVQSTTASVWPSVDNFRLAAAVPEASTYAMMLAGLAAVGVMARRRRQG